MKIGHTKAAGDEIIETITHLAFYSGWPTAMAALQIAKRAFEEAGV